MKDGVYRANRNYSVIDHADRCRYGNEPRSSLLMTYDEMKAYGTQ